MVSSSVTIKTRLPMFLVAVLLFLQIFSPARVISFLLILLIGALLVSWYWSRQLSRRIQLHRMRRYGWAQVGDVIEERFVMHNDAWLPVLWAELHDYSDLPGYNASRAVGLGPRASIRWTNEGSAERRGVYTLGPVEITTGDPLGLFEVKLRHSYSETFVVYPPIAALPKLFEPRGMARGSAHTSIRSLDLTTNAASVRPYVPGDALNRIHWPTTARRSTPEKEDIQVKEYDLEPSGDVWVVLDLDASVQAGEEADSTEEYAVILAASLASQLLRDNHAVGIAARDRETIVLPPRKGHQQLWEILRVLSGVHATENVSINAVLEQIEPVMGRGITVAVVTPSVNPEWVEGVARLLRRGVYVTSLLLDVSSFGGQGEALGVMNALADLQVPALLIDRDMDLQHISESRKQRPKYKTLATGRVIVTDPGDQQGAQWVAVGDSDG